MVRRRSRLVYWKKDGNMHGRVIGTCALGSKVWYAMGPPIMLKKASHVMPRRLRYPGVDRVACVGADSPITIQLVRAR